MNIGPLDRKITIQKQTATRGTAGGQSITWPTYHSCWAQKVEKAGNEAINNQATVATNQTTFFIRYKSGITENMRIVYDSENYWITFIKEHGRYAFLEIKAEKRDNQ